MTVEHALSCKKGGLVHIRHNDLAREWRWLGCCAFSPAYATHEPYIESSGEHETRETAAADGRQQTPPTGTPAPPPATQQPPRRQRQQRTTQQQQPSEASPTRVTVPEAQRADVGIHSFWQRGRATLFDVRVTDTHARSHRHRAPDKVLAAMEKEKKAKDLRQCHELRKDFTPLVYSCFSAILEVEPPTSHDGTGSALEQQTFTGW